MGILVISNWGTGNSCRTREKPFLAWYYVKRDFFVRKVPFCKVYMTTSE